MRIRDLFVALAFVLAQPFATAHAQSANAQPPSAVELEAARDIVRLMIVDSGAVPYAIEQAFARETPNMRANISSQSYFPGLSASEQEAVYGFLATIPAIALEELDKVMPTVIDEAARAYTDRFSEEHLLAVRAYMRSPQAEDYLKRAVLYGVQNAISPGSAQLPTPTPEEAAAEAAFNASPTGLVYAEQSAGLNAALSAAIQSSFAAIIPPLQQRVRSGVCRTLGASCPAELRG